MIQCNVESDYPSIICPLNLNLFNRQLFSASNLVYGDGVADDSGSGSGSGIDSDVRACKMKTALKLGENFYLIHVIH